MFADAFAHPRMHGRLVDPSSAESAWLGEILDTLNVVGAIGRYSKMGTWRPPNFPYTYWFAEMLLYYSILQRRLFRSIWYVTNFTNQNAMRYSFPLSFLTTLLR